MPRMRSKLTQRHPLSDQEMLDLIVSYLKHGFGHEIFFEEYVDAAAELTPKRLAREWPKYRDAIMASHDSPYSRPHGWWCAECPEPQRSVYLRAYKVDAAYHRAIHTPLPLHGRRAQSSDCTGPPEHEDLGDVQERLLIQLGILEDCDDEYEDSEDNQSTAG